MGVSNNVLLHFVIASMLNVNLFISFFAPGKNADVFLTKALMRHPFGFNIGKSIHPNTNSGHLIFLSMVSEPPRVLQRLAAKGREC